MSDSSVKNRPMSYIQQGYDALLNFVFYPYCYLCEHRLDSGKQLICERCWQRLRHPAGGRLLYPDDFHFQQKMYFDKAYALYYFSEKSLLLIHLFKYDHKKSLGERIGVEMGHYISSVSNLGMLTCCCPFPFILSESGNAGITRVKFLHDMLLFSVIFPW